MARLGRAAKGAKRGGKASPDALEPTDAKPTAPGGLPLPSPVAGTNLVIADIVLRAAGGYLRNRMEKGLLVKSYDKAKAEKLVDGRNLATSLALWGASRIATRSPVGLAVVAGGLAAKVLYDRGKRLESKRRARRQAKRAADSES
ncbi:MAG: hypothetical protein HC774_02675 [Sphingomonadales bacterium]|nr:hypothetical protein [Sphingomonadales bacterium]